MEARHREGVFFHTVHVVLKTGKRRRRQRPKTRESVSALDADIGIDGPNLLPVLTFFFILIRSRSLECVAQEDDKRDTA